ncbi:MAG: hypothetical protein QY306_15270 [Anaerolineales bacterium]|nr:MAG: hypothetical protein QY306_15270 [Anaerolineales bacterium]
MKPKLTHFLLLLALASLACNISAGAPTALAEEATAAPPVSTSAPEATSTPLPPTATIAPPSNLSEFLSDIRVTAFDDFSTVDGWTTYNPGTGKLSDGMFEITGQEDWSSGLVRNHTFGEGQGVVLEFKYTKGSQFEFILEAGEYETDSYRRFGVFGFDYPQANLTQGPNALGHKILQGNFQPHPDRWYNFMVGIGHDGNFIALMWIPDDPSSFIIYKETIGEKWDGLNWTFTAKAADTGMTLFLDNFAEISFGAIK